MTRETCVYCGKTLNTRSKEHIIPDSIGGQYKSVDICCNECNGVLSKKNDARFAKIFNPIISRIDSFPRTYRKKTELSCKGVVEYEGEKYNAIIKNGKVVECKEVAARLKRSVKELNFTICGYTFDVDNKAFKQGMEKIAFEFAIEKGIEENLLSRKIEIKRNKNGAVEDITFNFFVIPFFPLNPMDLYLEEKTEFKLYHHIALFSQEGKLWCYIDLFNTFQFYVLLSEDLSDEIEVSETYIQEVKKINRTVPNIRSYIRKPKDILIFSDYYNVDPTMDLEVLEHRIKESLQKESLRKDLKDIINPKLGNDYYQIERLRRIQKHGFDDEDCLYFLSLLLYFDEDDSIIDRNFRKVTITGRDGEITSYPLLIYNLLFNQQTDIDMLSESLVKWLVGGEKDYTHAFNNLLKRYTHNKFLRLDTFIKN